MGGLGGLGFIFAKYLISKVSAMLILCGRKKYSEMGAFQKSRTYIEDH